MSETKKIFLTLLSVFIAGSVLFAQNVRQQVRKNIRQAELELSSNNFSKALDLYRKAYQLDTANVQTAYKLGLCMYTMKKHKRESQYYFEKAQRAGILETNFYLGNLYHLQGKFEDAIRAFTVYKISARKQEFSNACIDSLVQKCKTAAELVNSAVNVSIENIGSTVNSEYPDYVPVISADESVLIFTSRRKGSTGGLLDPLGEYFEDVYIASKQDSIWTAPQSIGSNINTGTHDASVGLSADGEMLFLYRTSEDLISGDLYFSVFDGTNWLAPTKLLPPVNTKGFNEPSASLSSDGNTLYFSSNRPGGFGKKDIYKIVKLPNGEWGKAVNLGPGINTPEDEDSPFIHPDRKTLYFSSKAHKNMGSYDIFKTVNEDGKWSEPENMGYPVNTPDDDIYFVLSTDGKTGYYSSERSGGLGGADIYLIRFPDENMKLGVYKGVVLDSENLPLSAKITLHDAATKELSGIYNNNKLTGKFLMIVSPGKDYTMQVEAEGYQPFTGTVRAEIKQQLHTIKLQKSPK